MSEAAARLKALRALMQERGADAYLIPTDDFHGSEYVGDYFRCRKFLTGFTGSAGTAVVLADKAGLWTDGRYFLQADTQLKGSGFDLYRMGNEGVPTIKEFLRASLQEGAVLAFDGRCVSASLGRELEAIVEEKHGKIQCDEDLVDLIWADRPKLSAKPAWILEEAYTGKSRADKIRDLRNAMAAEGCNYFVLTSLDDIAWLLNIRGDDVECNPVVLSYLAVTPDEVLLFAQEEAFQKNASYTPLTEQGDAAGQASAVSAVGQADAAAQSCAGTCAGTVADALAAEGIVLRPYNDVYDFIRNLPKDASLMYDGARINYSLRRAVPEGVRIVDKTNPTLLPKSMKNPVEVENMKLAHIRDGVAMVRFLYWLKNEVPKGTVTEISAGEQLEVFRGEQPHYLGPSFTPIVGYKEHGAIIHYSSTPATNVTLRPEGTVLIDCGGQYLEGTTDITRTIVLGEVSQEQREYSTRVLQGNLTLAAAKFLYGCTGQSLDPIARMPLWEIGEDYNHGTGHGVGCLLNVHEGPQRIHWRGTAGVPGVPLEEGMVTSDEPGYYRAGAFGIRHENLMVCQKAEKLETGQFMKHETLTLVPFDIEGICPEMMSERERGLLNAYHKKVYETISPYLPEEEKEWLRHATREV